MSDAALSPERERQYRHDGYCVVEDLFTPDEVERTRAEITRIVDRHPDVPRELVQFEPAVRRGEVHPPTKELGVRKLFRMAVHEAYFRRLTFHPRLVAVATHLLGPDVVLLQSMLLMKPPRFGMRKVWHQDNAYFRLVPPDALGFWIALDDADMSNGCMQVVPGSQRLGIQPHDYTRRDLGLTREPSIDDVRPIALRAGDALIFHAEVFHYTGPNHSDRRRRALQYHYAACRCREDFGRSEGVQGEVLVAGRKSDERNAEPPAGAASIAQRVLPG